jgi:hypothetical protein
VFSAKLAVNEPLTGNPGTDEKIMKTPRRHCQIFSSEMSFTGSGSSTETIPPVFSVSSEFVARERRNRRIKLAIALGTLLAIIVVVVTIISVNLEEKAQPELSLTVPTTLVTRTTEATTSLAPQTTSTNVQTTVTSDTMMTSTAASSATTGTQRASNGLLSDLRAVLRNAGCDVPCAALDTIQCPATNALFGPLGTSLACDGNARVTNL